MARNLDRAGSARCEGQAAAVVVVGPDQLAEIVRSVVLDVLGERDSRSTRDGLLDSKELRQALNISRSTLGRLKSKGLPFIKVLDADRYDLKECVQWLREQTSRGDNGEHEKAVARRSDRRA